MAGSRHRGTRSAVLALCAAWMSWQEGARAAEPAPGDGPGVDAAALADEEATAAPWRLSAAYTGEYLENLRGGLERGGAYLDNLDLVLEFDGEQALGVPGLSALVHGLYNNGGSISGRYVGDTHIISNIEGVRAFRLYEAWIDYRAGGDAARSVRLGLYDVNTEFDASEVAGTFLNGTYGMGLDFAQAGLNGPSIFPFTSLGLRVQAGLGRGWQARAAVLDGVPGDPDRPSATAVRIGGDDGALYVAELEHVTDSRRVVLGHWRFTTDFDDLVAVDAAGDPVRRDGSHGSYAFVEGDLWRSASGARRLAGVARVGQASPDVNPAHRTLQLGLVLHEPVAGGAADQVGIALAAYRNGRPFLEAAEAAGAPRTRREVNVELTYRVEIGDWLALQPNLQWVMNPGSDPQLDDAWVAGLRFEVRGTSH